MEPPMNKQINQAMPRTHSRKRPKWQSKTEETKIFRKDGGTLLE